jgi:hypothetical protein
VGGARDWCRLLHGRADPRRLLAPPLSQAHREEQGRAHHGSPRLGCDDHTDWRCVLDRYLSLSLSCLGMPPNPTRS